MLTYIQIHVHIHLHMYYDIILVLAEEKICVCADVLCASILIHVSEHGT